MEMMRLHNDLRSDQIILFFNINIPPKDISNNYMYPLT